MSRRDVPVTTLLLVGSAVAISLVPGASALFIFDRAAIAGGEWWRVVTGSWVHFSSSHLAFDALATLIAGVLLEREAAPSVVALWITSALAVGFVVLLGVPGIERYAGLSGIAYALVSYLALRGVAAGGTWSRLCLTTLVIVAAKLLFELLTARSVFVPAAEGVVTVPAAHAAGVVVAVGAWLLETRRGWEAGSQRSVGRSASEG